MRRCSCRQRCAAASTASTNRQHRQHRQQHRDIDDSIAISTTFDNCPTTPRQPHQLASGINDFDGHLAGFAGCKLQFQCFPLNRPGPRPRDPCARKASQPANLPPPRASNNNLQIKYPPAPEMTVLSLLLPSCNIHTPSPYSRTYTRSYIKRYTPNVRYYRSPELSHRDRVP